MCRNLKCERYKFETARSLLALWMGLTRCFQFYNEERSHQALGYKTPDVAYLTATGASAKIVNKF